MLSAEWIAAAVGGQLHHPDPSSKISTFSIDTRTLRPGDFFIALAGSQTDGHRFLTEAFARGASGALIHSLESSQLTPNGRNWVVVENTLHALHRLARAYRALFKIPIVAVTGSSGKTTTKELIAHLLAQRFSTYRSPGNFNSEYGLPLALLQMPRTTEVAVFELGMQRRGEIQQLSEIVQPTVGVITMIGDAHLEFFESRDQIADAKWELIKSLPPEGLAVLNGDSVYLRERRFAGRTVWFGIASAGAEYRAQRIDASDLRGLHLEFKTPCEAFALNPTLLGCHNALNVVAACAVARELGLSMQNIQRAIASFSAIPHRMELQHSPCGWILDDSYNANPSAVKEALHTLKELKLPAHQKVFVFGEMRELGAHAPASHREIGQVLARSDVKQVFMLGELTSYAAEYLRNEAGWDRDRLVVARDRTELLTALRMHLAGTQNLILVKGSRAMELDQIVEALVC